MYDDILTYQGVVIRPPSEADSLIFQITLGCSDNRCVFCPAYKRKTFSVRGISEIAAEFKRCSERLKGVRRIFFADGDAITLEQSHLLKIFELVNRYFPEITRIGIYGSAKSIENKTVSDLVALKKLKLGIIYLGIETGDDEVYRFTNKYGSPAINAEACAKIKRAGIKLNTTIILGLGGKRRSKRHALNTAKILNQTRPDQIAALSLMISPEAPLHTMQLDGRFEPIDKFGFLEELKIIIENLDDFRCLFFSNHASNYFPIQARFPKDKASILTGLEDALRNRNEKDLTPEWQRGL